jgi:hypothetical protein
MKTMNIERASIAELVARFHALAMAQHEAVETFRTSRYNRLYDQIKSVERELQSREGDERIALLPLLNDPNIQVRYMAAYALLSLVPETALAALKVIYVSRQMPQVIDAGMTLRDYASRGIGPGVDTPADQSLS